MTSNFDSEKAKLLLEIENPNITEKNTFAELGKVLISIVIVLMIVYFGVFITSGVVISSLSKEKQLILEEKLSDLTSFKLNIIKSNPRNLTEIKNKIISLDSDYPDNPSQNIHIISMNSMNAFCAPNGNIYISEKLYKKLKNNEELTYILAHEMAHYRNRDHLISLRKNIANMSLLLVLSLMTEGGQTVQNLISNSITMSDLHHSRAQEIKADTYAGKKLIELYGSTKAGIEVLNLLDEESKLSFEFTSTHPLKENRIKLLESIK